MDERTAYLIVFTAAVAARQPHFFELAVKAAYRAGACQEDLLTAVETAADLLDIPETILAKARESVQAWQDIAAFTHRGGPSARSSRRALLENPTRRAITRRLNPRLR